VSTELIELKGELQFQLESVKRVIVTYQSKEETTEWLEGVAKGLDVAINLINETETQNAN
jgi:hypothetical protein